MPGQPGRGVRRQDYEYHPAGLAQIFFAVEPLTGSYWASVQANRTGATFAHQIKTLVDDVHAQAEKLVLVTDNHKHFPMPELKILPLP